jgi:hypothetical protein
MLKREYTPYGHAAACALSPRDENHSLKLTDDMPVREPLKFIFHRVTTLPTEDDLA